MIRTPTPTFGLCRRFSAPGLAYLAVISLPLILATLAHAQTSFVSTEIALEEFPEQILMHDLNGDGRQDFLNFSWQRELGRELLIYDQQANGTFNVTPRRVEIKSEIIAVGFADLRPEPGKELLLFANQGVFSLSSATAGYSGNLRPLLEWQSIAAMPNPDSVHYIDSINDINGDGFVDLLLPGDEVYGYFLGGEQERFTKALEFSTINLDLEPDERPAGRANIGASFQINATDGIKLDVSAERPTAFANFVENWSPETAQKADLLNREAWMPSVHRSDMNGDGKEDLVFINVGADILGQINLVFQNADGTFATKPDWQGAIDSRGNIQLVDLDGDQQTDLLRLIGEGNAWDAQLFRNQGGKFNLERPDQIMRFSGYDTQLNFIDINGDGRPELNVSYYTIPVVEAIRSSSIVRTQLLYASNAEDNGLLFSQRPNFRLEESFSAANVRALAEQMSLRFDIDGDSIKDAVYITDAGTLAAKKIDAELRIATTPFWQYVPGRIVLGFNVRDLNGDQKPDLVLRHGSAVTLLVASP